MADPKEGTSVISYIKPLDGLRSLAVLAVIFEHCYQNYELSSKVILGYFGVRLFFVLSGFLITSILLKSHTRALTSSDRCQFVKSFYVRRSLRIFPIYYLMITLLCVASIVFNLHSLQGDWIWRFFYLTNYQLCIHPTVGTVIGHLWTLAVEEQFYLIWPWVIIYLSPRRIGPIILAVILLAPISRMITTQFDVVDHWVRKPVWSCMDSLGMGALLAYCNSGFASSGIARIGRIVNRWGYWIGIPLAVIGLIARTKGAGGTLHGNEMNPITGFCLGIGEGLAFYKLIATCIDNKPSWMMSILSSKPLVDMGKISYGMYLYHPIVMTLALMGLDRLLQTDPRYGYAVHVYYLTTVTVTYFISWISWRLIEKPVLSLKDRYNY